MGASAAESLLVSATHNGHAIDTPVGFSWERAADVCEVRGPGKTGPSSIGVVAGALVAIVDFVGKGFMAVGDKGSLVIVKKTNAGATVTDTLSGMIALAFADQMNRDAPPGVYRQRFVHEGDMDTEPIAQA